MKRRFALLAMAIGIILTGNGCAMFHRGEVLYLPGGYEAGDPGICLVGKKF